MSNEPLGIFEELQERTRIYANRSRAVRESIIAAGPYTPDGPYAQPVNPFVRRVFRRGEPFHSRWPNSGHRRRPVFSEGKLGLNIIQVVQAVVLETGVPAAKMMKLDNRAHITQPRHVCIWACDRYCPEYSLPDLGFVFQRDHTTIINSIRWVNVRLEAHDLFIKTLIANVRLRLHPFIDFDT